MSDKSPARVRLPWSRSCFVCGEANPQGLQAEIYLVGDLVEMAFVPRREFVGWNEVVHGGLLGTVMDELMTWAAIVRGRRAYFAVELGIRYKAPLPPLHPCIARARVSGAKRKILETEAWIEDAEGTTFARATGRYFPAPDVQLEVFHRDFVTREGCLDLTDVFGEPPGRP
jgi:acyl-coenzyme A thioesterase PaaI-like protein